jgi:predicted RND superfamily exporter protein
MQQRVSQMSDSSTITLENVPETYKERYVSEDGSHFLMAFYSRKDIWDGLYTTPFLSTILRYVPNGTGSPVIMKELIDAIGSEGVKAFLISLIAIFVLLLIDFRSIKTTLVSLVPLIISAVWLFGLMGLFDIEFTIINVIGFPLLVGIGIDDGVHVIHRYRREGKLKLSYSISSIGKAILLTSITTILGFASLLQSDYRGYIGLGLVVSIGIGLCFITSILILPAILKIAWGGKKDYPKFFSE